jgi:hypothetical protein
MSDEIEIRNRKMKFTAPCWSSYLMSKLITIFALQNETNSLEVAVVAALNKLQYNHNNQPSSVGMLILALPRIATTIR